MGHEEYSKQRNAALEEFRKFVKELAKKGFTVQKLGIIGMNARQETEHIIADIEKNIVLSPDLTDLLK